MFSSPELERRRAARPRWLKNLITAGWVFWVVVFAVSGAGSFFLLCWIVAETWKGH